VLVNGVPRKNVLAVTLLRQDPEGFPNPLSDPIPERLELQNRPRKLDHCMNPARRARPDWHLPRQSPLRPARICRLPRRGCDAGQISQKQPTKP